NDSDDGILITRQRKAGPAICECIGREIAGARLTPDIGCHGVGRLDRGRHDAHAMQQLAHTLNAPDTIHSSLATLISVSPCQRVVHVTEPADEPLTVTPVSPVTVNDPAAPRCTMLMMVPIGKATAAFVGTVTTSLVVL